MDFGDVVGSQVNKPKSWQANKSAGSLTRDERLFKNTRESFDLFLYMFYN